MSANMPGQTMYYKVIISLACSQDGGGSGGRESTRICVVLGRVRGIPSTGGDDKRAYSGIGTLYISQP